MVQEIIRDEAFLSQKAELSTLEDLSVAQDLLDTLTAHKNGCVGMAANMIGVCKRIIIIDNEGKYMVMFNPKIIKKSGPHEAEEGYLSLTSIRKTRRCKKLRSRPMCIVLVRQSVSETELVLGLCLPATILLIISAKFIVM